MGYSSAVTPQRSIIRGTNSFWSLQDEICVTLATSGKEKPQCEIFYCLFRKLWFLNKQWRRTVNSAGAAEKVVSNLHDYSEDCDSNPYLALQNFSCLTHCAVETMNSIKAITMNGIVAIQTRSCCLWNHGNEAILCYARHQGRKRYELAECRGIFRKRQGRLLKWRFSYRKKLQ